VELSKRAVPTREQKLPSACEATSASVAQGTADTVSVVQDLRASSEPEQLTTLPMAVPLRNKPVLMLGGGSEAEDKTEQFLLRGAFVTLVAEAVTPRLAELARARRVTWFARRFLPSDIQAMHLVVLSDQDDALARELVSLRASARFWLCAIDQPAYSDLHFVSTVIRAPVQIGISTDGRAPLLSRTLRRALDVALDARFAQFAHSFAALRARLKHVPKQERTQRLATALNGFAMEVRLSYPADEDRAPDGVLWEVPAQGDREVKP
jgi:siroheme synthase-like protein